MTKHAAATGITCKSKRNAAHIRLRYSITHTILQKPLGTNPISSRRALSTARVSRNPRAPPIGKAARARTAALISPRPKTADLAPRPALSAEVCGVMRADIKTVARHTGPAAAAVARARAAGASEHRGGWPTHSRGAAPSPVSPADGAGPQLRPPAGIRRTAHPPAAPRATQKPRQGATLSRPAWSARLTRQLRPRPRRGIRLSARRSRDRARSRIRRIRSPRGRPA